MKSSAFNVGYSVHSTIDSILSKGAQQLYNKYIMSKLPAHMQYDVQQNAEASLNPITMLSQNIQSNIKKVHEPIINRISLASRSQGHQSNTKKK